MKIKILAAVLLLGILSVVPVQAEVADFDTVLNTYRQDRKLPEHFPTEDGSGKKVQVLKREDTVYVTAKEAVLYTKPGTASQVVGTATLGTMLFRVGVCSNGWSKVILEQEDRIIGYVQNSVLSDKTQLVEVSETVKVLKDSEILDYPGRKDGEVVGEVLELDEVQRTAKVDAVWSRISYTDMEGQAKTGYIPTSALDVKEEVQMADASETAAAGQNSVEAGVISESDGKGVFADAVDGVTAAGGADENGVQIGNAVAVSSDASLLPLGTFRITHYCQCAICCGPWANGITSTGVTATTNRTIAVDPTQIPYGSQVVINGQVYVAEDCGGAIKTNCIDIYVASHEEGESKGVYYTDVFLVQ